MSNLLRTGTSTCVRKHGPVARFSSFSIGALLAEDALTDCTQEAQGSRYTMEALRGKCQPKRLTVSTTSGRPAQNTCPASSDAARAKTLPAKTPAMKRAKAVAAGRAGEATQRQRFVRAGGLRKTQENNETRRRDNPTEVVPVVAAQCEKPLARTGVPSKVVIAPRSATQPFKIPDGGTPSAAVAATREPAESHSTARMLTTLQARRSTLRSSSNAYLPRIRTRQQSMPLLNDGKAHVNIGTCTGDHMFRSENTTATASCGSTSGVRAVLSRSLRGTSAMCRTVLPCQRPQLRGKTLALRGNVTVGPLASNASPLRESSATVPVPASAHVSNVLCASPCDSSDGLLSAAPSSVLLPAGSSGSPHETCATFVVASSPSLSTSLKYIPSRQKASDRARSPFSVKKDASLRPLSTAKVLSKTTTTRAAKEATGDSGRAAKRFATPDARAQAVNSQMKSQGVKQRVRKADALPGALPLPCVPQHRVSSPVVGTSGAIKPPSDAVFNGTTHRTLGASQVAVKKVRGGSPSDTVSSVTDGDTDSLATQTHPWGPLDYASDSRSVLFSSTAIYCASAASSVSSLNSDKSSRSSSCDAAAGTTQIDASPATRAVATGAGSPLRSILRLPPATSLSMAARRPERVKRPRRNARFALFGDAATSAGSTIPRETPEVQYAQPLKPATARDVAATTGDEEDETALASFDDASTEQAMASLSAGERFPTRWWGATRKRVKVTKALLERWQMDTLAKWDDEQKQEIDVLISSVEAVGVRVHDLLTQEFQELIRPEWVIHNTDSLVQRMLNTREAAEERARTLGRKRVDVEIPYWRGPSAFSVFGDQLLMVSKTPYSIIGVYARRTWAATLPVAVADPIFLAAEEERQSLAGPTKRLRNKAEELRKRFLSGAKSILSSQSPYSIAKGKSGRRATISRGSSCSLLRKGDVTMERGRTAAPLAGVGATTAAPGIPARADEEVMAGQSATAEGGERGGQPLHVQDLTRTVRRKAADSNELDNACTDVLALEVAACLGVQRGRCAFPVEALKPHPPHGYGRAPIQAEDVRILSELEDFLLANHVPIKRPSWDVRHTPLMSTLRRPSSASSEGRSTSTGKAEDFFSHEFATSLRDVAEKRSNATEEAAEDRHEGLTSAADTVGGHESIQLFRCCGAAPNDICGSLALQSWNLVTCPTQQPDGVQQQQALQKIQSRAPLRGEELTISELQSSRAGAHPGSSTLLSAKQEARRERVSVSEPTIGEALETLPLLECKEQGGDRTAPYATAASGSLNANSVILAQIHRYAAPAVTANDASREKEHLTAKMDGMERKTVGARLRAHSSVDALTLVERRSFPLEKQHQGSALTRLPGEGGTSICWEARTFCGQLKRAAGNKLLRQEDVKVSEFWKLRFNDDGSSTWSYEGLQCEPSGVSLIKSDALTRFCGADLAVSA